MMEPLSFANILKKSKKGATEYVRNLLKDTGRCHSVKETNMDVYNKLMEVLSNHPEAYDKLHNAVDLRIQYSNQILVINSDTTETDISWKCCISARPPIYYLSQSLRHSIKDQIANFKCKSLKTSQNCSICTQPTNGYIHIDHIVPFADLVKSFHTINKYPLPTKFNDNDKGWPCVFKDEDKEYESSWQSYHSTNATLRLTCPPCNIKRGHPGIKGYDI